MAITNSDSNPVKDYNVINHWSQDINVPVNKSLIRRPYALQVEKEIVKFLILTGNIGKTRNDLVVYLNYPRTTIYDSLNRMSRKGLIEMEHKLSIKGKGRPQTIFFLKGILQGNSR